MAKKNKMTKIMATLALFGIIISIIGTGLLFIFSSPNSNPSNEELTPEQYTEIQKIIESQENTINIGTGETNTLTGEIN